MTAGHSSTTTETSAKTKSTTNIALSSSTSTTTSQTEKKNDRCSSVSFTSSQHVHQPLPKRPSSTKVSIHIILHPIHPIHTAVVLNFCMVVGIKSAEICFVTPHKITYLTINCQTLLQMLIKKIFLVIFSLRLSLYRAKF